MTGTSEISRRAFAAGAAGLGLTALAAPAIAATTDAIPASVAALYRKAIVIDALA